ncbi:Protein of unknown function [Gryllus bimaculatus]|nr:Protein of unknown function [Gryllus bimaculatus]
MMTMKGEPGPSGTYRSVDPDAAFASEALKGSKQDVGNKCFKMPNDKSDDLKEDMKICEDSNETISDELTDSSSSQHSDDFAILTPCEIGDFLNSETSSQDEYGNISSGKHSYDASANFKKILEQSDVEETLNIAKNTLQKDINQNVIGETLSTSQNSTAVTNNNERSAYQFEINNNVISGRNVTQNIPNKGSKCEHKDGNEANVSFKTNEKGKIGPKFFKKGKKTNHENAIEERKSEFKPDISANESKYFETQQTETPSTSQMEQTFKEIKNDAKATLKAKAKSGGKYKIKSGYMSKDKCDEKFEMKSGNDFKKNVKMLIGGDGGFKGDNSEGNTGDIPTENTGAKRAFRGAKYFARMKFGSRGPQPVDEAAASTSGGGSKKGGKGDKGDQGGKAAQNEDLAKQGPSNAPAA